MKVFRESVELACAKEIRTRKDKPGSRKEGQASWEAKAAHCDASENGGGRDGHLVSHVSSGP